MRIACIAGARPNFVKIGPLVAALGARGDTATLIHTGQHYDRTLSQSFFETLGIPAPDVNLKVGSGTHAEQTARVMLALDPIVARESFDALAVVGDVNSTLAATLVAVKRGLPVAHVEAGLRSGDRTMPEELNRILTDAVADLLLVSEPSGVTNLAREGVDSARVRLVGNIMIDTLLANRARAAATGIGERLGLTPRGYALLTMHRPSNVDAPGVLRRLASVLAELAAELPMVFPAHPRTVARLADAGLRLDETPIRVLEPLPYLEFLALQDGARLVLTDSGGIQEETTVLGVPCLTLRDNTERPITCAEGTNVLVGRDPDRIRAAFASVLAGTHRPDAQVPDLWDGHTAPRIVAALHEAFGA